MKRMKASFMISPARAAVFPLVLVLAGCAAGSADEVDAEAEAAAKARLAAADKINNKKQCELARKNYAALNASVRVSRTNEKGETVRMTDDERVKAMQAAQQGIKKYCQ